MLFSTEKVLAYSLIQNSYIGNSFEFLEIYIYFLAHLFYNTMKINPAMEKDKFLPAVVKGTLGLIFTVICVTILKNFIVQAPPDVTSKSVEVTGIILGTSTSPYYDGQSPTTDVWVQTGEVIPNKGSFYCKSTVVEMDGTSRTAATTRQLTSNAAQFVSFALPRPMQYYNLEIRDKEDGVTLYNGNWYPEDIAGYY